MVKSQGIQYISRIIYNTVNVKTLVFSFFDTVSFLNADIPHFRSESSGRHAARWTVSGPLFCTHATQVGHQFRKPLNGCNGHRWWAADKGYVAPYPM